MISRRRLLRGSLMGLGVSALSLSSSATEVCSGVVTPAQTEGPFYPISEQLDSDTDLTQIKGQSQQAIGERVYVRGRVLDRQCQPIKGAVVEVWQACHSGKYNHPSDPNPAQLDPDFQYYGRAITNENGEYLFKTIRPGQYPATATWMRPSHIHFKVHLRGFEELTTQMYFADDELNQSDLILQNLPSEERESVVISFEEAEEFDHPVGSFDITLDKIVPASNS